ncbi:MAG: hypothetical protein J4F43_08225 [Dehalococcoidia bacterium]|nr:hypothetical protein [Dehalococcoidia bacterium]
MSRVLGFLANIVDAAPLGRKLRFLVRNTWIKACRRSWCCGNAGQTGC